MSDPPGRLDVHVRGDAGGTRLSRPNRIHTTTRRSIHGLLHVATSALLAAALLLGPMTDPAAASPETMRRGLGNIVGGPLDALLSPIQGGYTLAINLRDIDDTAAVRVVYVLPGWIWLTAMNFGSGGIRAVTGLLEMVPGVLLFPFKTDIDPMFDAVESARAFVNYDNPLADKVEERSWLYYNPIVTPFTIRLKFGISYTRAEE
jgi:hypothetical protein